MESNIFLQISALLGLTITIAFIIRLLKQPLMVAYILAGIISGPVFLNILRGDHAMFEAFSQFGIVLLLFVLGLNLNLNHLKKIGKVATLTGCGQVLFTFIFGFIILHFLGFSFLNGIYLALAITFSSTIIIVKLLNDKKDTETTYGKYTIGLMLIQDLIAISILILLGNFTSDGDWFFSLMFFLLKGLAILIILFFVSRYFLPKILDKVASSGEFLFIFTIAWCFGVASLVHLVGFSVEIGAVAAGLTLGASPYQAGIAGRIKPLRDFFIVLFFIILGSQMGMSDFGSILIPGTILSLFILIGNPLILYVLFRFSKFTRKNSFLAGITAAQVSEFGFILLYTGQNLGYVNGKTLSIFTFVAILTIFISSYLITYNKQFFEILRPIFNFFGKDKYQQKNLKMKKFEAIVIGYHRIGWKVCEALREKKISFAVIDHNPESIKKLKSRGIPAFFGDVSDSEFLEAISWQEVKLIISTLPKGEDQKILISHIRALNKDAFIVANLSHSFLVKELYRAGADYVMMPHLLGGKWISETIKRRKWTRRLFLKLQKEQEEEMSLGYLEKN